MNELFDKLILRIFFTLFMCFMLYMYKYAHGYLYPSSRKQFFKNFYPSKNPADTIHLFSRLLGIGLVFSQFTFYMSDGILYALFDFFVLSTIATMIFLASIYIIESIVLYNFEYIDEILKRKNLSFSIISAIQAISIASIMRTILVTANDTLILLLFLWLFAIVIFGFASKSYKYISKLSFQRLLIQKDISIAISYGGYIFGWSIIINSALIHDLKTIGIKIYCIQVVLKILLSIIIFPIFKKCLTFIFQIKDDYEKKTPTPENLSPDLGYGIYEGVTFLTAALLTSVITGGINFGTFYPVF
jgi:hypothetical protein